MLFGEQGRKDALERAWADTEAIHPRKARRRSAGTMPEASRWQWSGLGLAMVLTAAAAATALTLL